MEHIIYLIEAHSPGSIFSARQGYLPFSCVRCIIGVSKYEKWRSRANGGHVVNYVDPWPLSTLLLNAFRNKREPVTIGRTFSPQIECSLLSLL
jgi:hypothetical protein